MGPAHLSRRPARPRYLRPPPAAQEKTRRARRTAIYLQKRWRGRTGREFYRRKRSAKLLVDFVRRCLWEKLQDRAFGGRPLPRMKRSGPGSRSGEPYALPPSEPADEPTAETASVRTDDGEEMVAVRSDDSDEEFIQYLKTFEDPGAFIDFHTIGQPAWKLGEPPKKRKGKRKKKQIDPGGFINVPWNRRPRISLDYITTSRCAFLWLCSARVMHSRPGFFRKG